MNSTAKFIKDTSKELVEKQGFLKAKHHVLLKQSDIFMLVIQFLIDRKDKSRLTVGFSVMPLIVPVPSELKGVPIMKPGNRLDSFGQPINYWWDFTMENINISVHKLIFVDLMNWFRKYTIVDNFSTLEDDPKFRTASSDWRYFKQAHIYLYKNKIDEAQECLRKIVNDVDVYPFLKERSEELLHSLCRGKIDIKNYLEKNLHENKEALTKEKDKG